MVAKAHVDIVATDKTKGAFRSANAAMATFKRTALSLAPVIGAGLFVGATRSASEFADSIDKASKAAGVSAEFLQEMRFAGDKLGVTTTQVDEGFRRFTRRMGEFANSAEGPAKKAIERLKIEIRDGNGEVRNSEAIFRDFARAIGEMETAAERGAVSAQIFGDDVGPKFRLLIDEGIEGVDRLAREARDLGVIMDQDVIDNAVQAKDDFSKLSNVVKTQLTAAILELSPVITSTTGFLLDMAKAWNSAFGDVSPLQQYETQLESLRGKVVDLTTELNETRAGPDRQDYLIAEIQRTADEMDRLQGKIKELRQEGEKPISITGNGATTTEIQGQTKDLEALEAQLFPLQDAAREYAKQLELIEQSGWEPEKQAEAIKKIQQAFADATGGARDFTQTAADVDQITDRLFPLENATKQFTQELKAIEDSNLDDALKAETAKRLTVEFNQTRDAISGVSEEQDRLGRGAIDLGFAFSSSFEDAILSGEKLSDVLQGLSRDIAQIVIRQTFTQPVGGGIASLIGGTIPQFALGTQFAPGGISIVGERGPELVDLPRGSRVTPAGAVLGGTTVNVVNNTGESSQVQRSNDSNGRELINVIIGEMSRDVMSEGPFSQSLKSAFNLRRQGVIRS